MAAASTTTVNATVQQPAPNPLLDAKNVSEVGALVLLFAAVSTAINKWFDGRYKSREEKHGVEHERLNDRIADIKHDLKNTDGKIAALELVRAKDVERIVKVESDLKAINEGQVRIEHALDTMRDEGKQGRAELVEAIRRLQDLTNKRT